MTKRAVNKKFGLRHDNLVRRELKDPKFASLYYQAGAELELRCRVAEVLNRVMRHRSGSGYDHRFYRTLAKKSGVSARSIQRFLERGGDVREAARILHPFGYQITRIHIGKLPQQK